MPKPGLTQRGPMRRRLRVLRRRREAMLLDLGALALEMHRHGRFLPDALARRAAEAVGTDAELRSLSRALEAGEGQPDLIDAGIAGNCESCGALHTLGAAYCSQCGTQLEPGRLPRAAVLGQDPGLADEPQAPPPRPAPKPAEPARLPPPTARGARATRVRQRLNEPARPSPGLPAGLLAGIAAGIVVIGLGILALSGGDDGAGNANETERAAKEQPAERPPEPPPDDEPITPTQEPERDPEAPDPTAALAPVEGVTAGDYDPTGDDQEHAAEAPLAVDGDRGTTWPTEEYETGDFQKAGVGLYLEPAEAIPARGLDLVTTTPGFDITIYGAEADLPDSLDDGWTEIASEERVPRRGRIDLDTAGRDFAYYLVWITALPPDGDKVEVAEARLLR